MISILAGDTGDGKTKQLMGMANTSVRTLKGNIVFVTNSNRYSLEINHKIRYINVKEFPIMDSNEFYGFVCGILSEDHDINEIYLDSLLKLATIEISEVTPLIEKLERISKRYNVKFILGLSCEVSNVPNGLKEYLVA
ncbi:hypothetical protein EDC19_0514 [Natranaerovirga hydrolytica]|uniref:Twitching motility protein PilT n=1 Tax=Natranaerovirga hydrolytica TaxID=680378 RepID=A0A4R1MXV0_9FIRM|nr:twitching motility protein PilT [Natranaerovirga hydrolytica]TCK98097.1 hypothetical protein EDC19_0514 [Natranaerovirga hydrolytica]